MRITEQDIIRTALELRDEENASLHVRPWHRHSRFSVPAWLAAVPAAAVAGFFFGLWTSARPSASTPLTAMTDTIYIMVKDTASPTLSPSAIASRPASQSTKAAPGPQSRSVYTARPVATGRSMSADRIRYDLLVKN